MEFVLSTQYGQNEEDGASVAIGVAVIAKLDELDLNFSILTRRIVSKKIKSPTNLFLVHMQVERCCAIGIGLSSRRVGDRL